MKKMVKEIIERLKVRIMEHQKENGFETIFDFINEDLSELTDILDKSVTKVQIIKASNPGYWYAGFIGQIFEVEDYTLTDTDQVERFIVKPSPDTEPLFMIDIDDANPVVQ